MIRFFGHNTQKFPGTPIWTAEQEKENVIRWKREVQSAWNWLEDGERHGLAVWGIPVLAATACVMILAYGVLARSVKASDFECPENCEAIQSVDGTKGISTINLATGKPNEFRWCPTADEKFPQLFPGYVIELHTVRRGICDDITNPTYYFHIVRGRELNKRKYQLVSAVARFDVGPHGEPGDSRPALSNRCYDTEDDKNVICDGQPFVLEMETTLNLWRMVMRTAAMTHENSTVDGSDWPEDRFAALDFSVELYPDKSYPQGCLKYVPCAMDDDPTAGHRVRSRFPDAMPVRENGVWMWQVNELES